MQIIRPSSTFKIVWQTADPNDTATYYPQVVIKRSTDSAVLDTVNLALESAGRYSANWQVPMDTTGQGTQIDMTVNVYTDSGFTAYSPNYSKENRIYNIFDMVASLLRTGGGDNTDYDLIARLIDRAVSKALGSQTDYSDKFVALGKLITSGHDRIVKLEDIVSQKNNDEVLGGIRQEAKSTLESLKNEITEVKIAGQRAQELMMEGLQNLAGVVGKLQDEINDVAVSLESAVNAVADAPVKVEGLEERIAKIDKTLKAILKSLSTIQTVTMHTGMPLPKEEADAVFAEPDPPKKDFSAIAKNLLRI